MKPELAPQPWMVDGACRSVGAEVFFPDARDYESEREAIRVCASCPVWESCRAYAFEYGPFDGIWGGLTARARERALKGRAA